VFKSLCIEDLQRPIHIIPSFAANLANHCRNLANWTLNLAISEANLAIESSFSLGIMAICEVSEVISLPSYVRTRTCARAGETIFKYRSGRKITSHNLVTSQLGSSVGGCSNADQSDASDHRTTLHHVARSLTSRPARRLSHSSRQCPNGGPHNASATMALISPKRWVLPQKTPRSWAAGTAARLDTVCFFCPTPSSIAKGLHYDHHFTAD
jgi:hypothetical protein